MEIPDDRGDESFADDSGILPIPKMFGHTITSKIKATGNFREVQTRMAPAKNSTEHAAAPSQALKRPNIASTTSERKMNIA